MSDSQKKRVQLDDETKALLQSTAAMPPSISVEGRSYRLVEPRAAGFKGVVWRGQDHLGGDVAIKLTTHEDYVDRSYLGEASAAATLRASRSFAGIVDAGVVDLPFADGTNRKFVVFVEQWIPGTTLRSYLAKKDVGASFLLAYVLGMCEALSILQANQFRHDDLHADNVMLASPPPGALHRDEFTVKIVDLGSLKSDQHPTAKDKDDHQWFAEHLLMICNAIRRRKALPLAERRFMRLVVPLLQSIMEEDRSVALIEPSRIVQRFHDAYTRAVHPAVDESSAKLNDPFDYIAAEHIASDALLVRLFAESCPWFREVASPNPILLTGPRGCGKSMVFRRVSLNALLYKSDEDIRTAEVAGFYLSCSADLRNRLGWITTGHLASRFQREIVQYFNLLLMREVVQTLASISLRADRFSLFGFGLGEETRVHEFLMSRLGITDPERLRLHGVSRIEHALEVVDGEIEVCYRHMLLRTGITRGTDAMFLAEFTRFLSDTIPYFGARKIAFLIDDFSIHRITVHVQEVLNQVIWDRQATHVFKLSAEKHGAVAVDRMKATVEPTREMREFDIGQYFLTRESKTQENFARELLTIRLALAGYKGTPEQLLGRSSYPEGSLGKALRARSELPGRRDDQYSGLETIANLCSGDISVLLEIYRRIFELGGVKPHTVTMVAKHDQHTAVQAVSRAQLSIIKDYAPQGPKMHEIAGALGTLSRRILREGKLQKSGDDVIPCETTRIEVDQPPGQGVDELGERERELVDELVRRAVFIEMEPGRSRHGFVPTLRWQLRRIYAPAFGASLAKNTAIKWNFARFKYFLIEPASVTKDEFNKIWRGPGEGDPLSLFDGT